MRDILKTGTQQLNIDLSDTQISQLIRYSELLKEWNEKINLTAITDDEGIATKHFLDSLSAFTTGKVGKNVIDVGTGAGFPGLVLKIAKPDMNITLLDSLAKRLNFLKEVAFNIDICDGIDFVHMRAEDGGKNAAYRGAFDTVVSRAVANLKVLSEFCIPFLKVGGYFLAMKGPMAESEMSDAKRAITILGGQIEEIKEVKIPFTDLNHKIIVIKKIRQTPMKYPRKMAVISKNPIEQCYNLPKKHTK